MPDAGAVSGLRAQLAKLRYPWLTGSQIIDHEVSLGKIAAMGGGGPGILRADKTTGAAEWAGPSNYPAVPLFKSASDELTFPKISGTSFPTSPVDGQLVTRTDYGDTVFEYSSARSGWLSTWEQKFWCAWAGDVSTSIFMIWSPGAAQFNATYGPIFGFQTKVTSIGVFMQTSGTAQVGIYGGGSAITGATLSLSSEQNKSSDSITPSAVAAATYLGMKRDSGTVEGPGMGYFGVRRFETT